jgi:all-trans-retinol 13,14-reductase
MAVGAVYRPALVRGRFDAIVVGSGIGGLATAALLARQGRRVLVLERHYVAGGFTHAFRRPGYEWDVGVHYVGEVHRPGSTLRRVFDDLSAGRLRWEFMGEVYDRVIVGERAYDLVAGRERFVEGLARHFPGERAVIERYVGLVREAARAASGFFAERALPPWLGALARPVVGRAFRRHADRTTHDVLAALGASRELAGVLTAQYGDYGLTPRQSSFAIHAMVAKHYLDGGSYPVGGAAAIAASIVPTIEEAGGAVLLAAEVEEVLVRGGRAAGVRVKTGDEIPAPVVVSDAGVMNTFARLLRPTPAWAAARLQAVRPSVAHVCLYIGANGSAAELGLGRSNLWVYPDYDHDENVRRYLADPSAPLPLAYISFPSAKDPDWDRRHPGSATIEAVGLAPYEWFERWEGSRWRRRGGEYDSLKRQLCERLLEAVHRHVPQVRGRIERHEVSTPLSTRHFANYARGEIYGIEHTPERFRLSWLRPHTPVPGLFLTGQDVVTDGLGGAVMAGVLTASAILRRNVLRDIVRRTG